MNTADIILLLISADFLASDYCYSTELARALQRQEQGTARVIPVLLRPVDWRIAPLNHLQALPTNNRPITLWENRDEAFENVARGIRAVVDQPHQPLGVDNFSGKLQPNSSQSMQSDPLSLWKILGLPAVAWCIGHTTSLVITGVSVSPFVIVGTLGGIIGIILFTWVTLSVTNTAITLKKSQLLRLAVYFLLAGLVSGFVGLSLWLLGCDQDLGLNFKQAIGCRDTTRFAWKLLAGLSSMVALGGACFAVLLELSAGRFGLRR